MLIAITAAENSMQADIDPRFGRAAYYMIINTLTDETTAHNNSDGINASNGAGTGAAQTLSEYGVEALYTGRVGPKAAAVLDQAKIPYHENITGTVQQVLEQIKTNKVTAKPQACDATSPSKKGRGMGCGMGMGKGQRQGSGRGMGKGCSQ